MEEEDLMEREDGAGLEIGAVYRTGERYYLAVSQEALLSIRSDGSECVTRLRDGMRRVRFISVEDLCAKWGITLERLDEISLEYVLKGRTPRPVPPFRRLPAV